MVQDEEAEVEEMHCKCLSLSVLYIKQMNTHSIMMNKLNTLNMIAANTPCGATYKMAANWKETFVM